jgi:hypothetical protein
MLSAKLTTRVHLATPRRRDKFLDNVMRHVASDEQQDTTHADT